MLGGVEEGVGPGGVEEGGVGGGGWRSWQGTRV